MDLIRSAIALVMLMACLALSACGIKGLSLIQRYERDIKRQTYSMIFISESFRNTVHGNGFENLNEWKKICSVLWNLEEITCETQGHLVKGTWSGKYGSGVVYEKTSD